MNRSECDILIVGAGPAGCSAAFAAAQSGAHVTVVDRKNRVGVPVRCAEYIPALLLGEMDLGRDFVVQSVRGMRTYLPDGEIIETRAPGFIINRDLFDQSLAKAAKDEGAFFRLSTRAVARDRNKVILKSEHNTLSELRAKVIIGADGPRSAVGKWFGSVNLNMIAALQNRVPLRCSMDMTEVYFRKEMVGGYGWLFPKGNEANVGVGIKRTKKNPPHIHKTLKEFLSHLQKEGKIGNNALGQTFGWVPVAPLNQIVHENMILAGDAAGQTHPVTGAGVPHAFMGGRMAGEWAARSAKAEDLSLLKEYERECSGFFGETLQRAWFRRQQLEKEWDRLDEVIKGCWVAFREYHAAS